MRYLVTAAAMPTTSSTAVIATGTSLKTLIQFKPSVPCKIVEWGISFDGSAAATPGKIELIETDVAATVTAFANADLHKQDLDAVRFGDPTSSLIAVGTTSSGFNASGENSITAVRLFDVQFVAPTNQYVKQFPLGREPQIDSAKFARIRVLFGTGVNAYPYLVVEF